jgi:hypothetical protein
MFPFYLLPDTRAATSLFSEADQTIAQFQQQFDKLRDMLQVRTVVSGVTAIKELDIVVRRILERVDNIRMYSSA